MKKLLQNIACMVIMLAGVFPVANSQAIPQDSIKTQLVKEWQRAKTFTNEYLDVMPADKYSFKPQDSIRNFAQQMLHLAGANIFFISAATDAPPPPLFSRDMEQRTSAQSKDSVAFYVNKSYDYCIAAVKNLPLDKWGETKKLFAFTETRFALMIKAFEHQTHHRGQATIYIRTAGYKPPQEKLF